MRNCEHVERACGQIKKSATVKKRIFSRFTQKYLLYFESNRLLNWQRFLGWLVYVGCRNCQWSPLNWAHSDSKYVYILQYLNFLFTHLLLSWRDSMTTFSALRQRRDSRIHSHIYSIILSQVVFSTWAYYEKMWVS